MKNKLSTFAGLARHVVTAAAGFLAANPEAVDPTISAAVFAIGAGWSAYEKHTRPATPTLPTQPNQK